jgi:hypothetical protein
MNTNELTLNERLKVVAVAEAIYVENCVSGCTTPYTAIILAQKFYQTTRGYIDDKLKIEDR